MRTISPEDAPDKPTVISIDFEKGDPVAIDGKAMSPATLLTHLNALGRDNGIGRLDLVENRFVGMAVAGYWQSQFVVLLMLCFGVIVALALSVIGRLLALVLNRGNLVFNAIALFVQIAATILVITYVGGAM